jgi:hypothetical protein
MYPLLFEENESIVLNEAGTHILAIDLYEAHQILAWLSQFQATDDMISLTYQMIRRTGFYLPLSGNWTDDGSVRCYLHKMTIEEASKGNMIYGSEITTMRLAKEGKLWVGWLLIYAEMKAPTPQPTDWARIILFGLFLGVWVALLLLGVYLVSTALRTTSDRLA